jgi:hypothetical protein
MSSSRYFYFFVGSWVRWISFNRTLLRVNFAFGHWILGLCYCGDGRCWDLLILGFYGAFNWSRFCFGHVGCRFAKLLTVLGRGCKCSGCLNWLPRRFSVRALTTLGLLDLSILSSVIACWKIIFSKILLDWVGSRCSFSLRFKFQILWRDNRCSNILLGCGASFLL